MRNASPALLLMAGLGGCASPGGPYPSLQPRAAEQIDPRVPVERPVNDRPATPTLIARLARLVDDARGGAAAFEPLAADAERLAAAAGSPGSESWIAAQQALSAAVAARQATAQALADIDALGASALEAQAGIAPSDLAAIRRAAALVSAIEQRQAQRIAAVQRTLGG